ncbi:energy transducer TonB [Paraburkholderia sp. LEh10]|jgi:protein TonB|uniref:energy transducer TonB n=1 Tax=Paraburkholderia sp. LEh10 TaxID=2821353 RepID=UPI001AE4E03B|nr:energy transducer TonB [Paraburkholderia sp. LEh10]MBP0594923.1 energy transducer TonB [Paraburkholderia sp. LEh10]
MQATPTLPAGFAPDASARIGPRIATATGIVIGLHVVALVVAFAVRDVTPVRPIESRTITAELISPAPVAAPAAIQSTPTPPPPKPVPVQKVTPKVQPRPTPKPAPTPMPVAPAPSQHEIAPESAPPTPPAAPAPTAPTAAAAPAAGKPTMALSAPKNVSHLDCSIAQPDYPAMSRRRGETGTAMVRFVVGLTGKIENIELKKSSGYERLDQAALEAMRSSSCKPYLENGEPIRAAYTQPFDFSLNN